MKKILIISIVAILVLSIAGYFSVNYMFDKFVGNHILGQLDLDNLQDHIIENETGQGTDTTRPNSGRQSEGVNDITETEENRGNIDEVNENKEDASRGAEASKGNQRFTQEDLKEIQDGFSTVDKLKVMKIITGKLSAGEIKSLTNIASGGVDNSELNTIKRTLKNKLNKKDVDYLRDLYKKYN